MNQDQVKAKLLSIEAAPLEFSLIFSGKKSKRVNGLYKPESAEIIIHNRNFEPGPGGDNLLLYTAIHEYSHHLHACSRGGRLSVRAHTAEFWAIFHGLLENAEAAGIYNNVFGGSEELVKLTERIKQRYLKENGALMKELGRELLKAQELCTAAGGRFEDYLDRVLRIPRGAATMAVKMYNYDLDSSLGADNMRFLAGISNEDTRLAAEQALLKGKSPDTVKTAVRKKSSGDEGEDLPARLEKERRRLERTIASLTKRLREVEAQLQHGG
jgi:hypothetical protein